MSGNNKKITPPVTKTVKVIVANALYVPVKEINNDTKLDYWAAMDAIFDLGRLYPNISFPEDCFDRYCRMGALRNYVVGQMKNPRTK